jgi:hypothetical protein
MVLSARLMDISGSALFNRRFPTPGLRDTALIYRVSGHRAMWIITYLCHGEFDASLQGAVEAPGYGI